MNFRRDKQAGGIISGLGGRSRSGSSLTRFGVVGENHSGYYNHERHGLIPVERVELHEERHHGGDDRHEVLIEREELAADHADGRGSDDVAVDGGEEYDEEEYQSRGELGVGEEPDIAHGEEERKGEDGGVEEYPAHEVDGLIALGGAFDDDEIGGIAHGADHSEDVADKASAVDLAAGKNHEQSPREGYEHAEQLEAAHLFMLEYSVDGHYEHGLEGEYDGDVDGGGGVERKREHVDEANHAESGAPEEFLVGALYLGVFGKHRYNPDDYSGSDYAGYGYSGGGNPVGDDGFVGGLVEAPA